jgi:DNA-binding LacI/PurR family transcriptional regulator
MASANEIGLRVVGCTDGEWIKESLGSVLTGGQRLAIIANRFTDTSRNLEVTVSVMSRKRAATLNDIAERVGVSRTTASAVLGRPSRYVRVSDGTRNRILAAARELDYRPNAVARSLRDRRTHLIGFYSGHGFISPRNAFLGEIIRGLQIGCGEHCKDLLMHGLFPGRAVDEIFQELADGRIDGIVVCEPADDPLVGRLRGSRLPAIVVVDAVPGIPSVVADDAGGMHMVVDHLYSRGHRRVIYRGWKRRLVSVERRRQALLGLATERGMSVTEWTDDYTAADVVLMLDEWQGAPRQHRATAVICWNDVAAYDVLAACRAREIDVPGELAIVGFDGIEVPAPEAMPLTTVRAPWCEIARRAVSVLLDHAEDRAISDETVFPVELVERATT